MTKRVLALLLAAMMVFALAACTSDTTSQSSTGSTPADSSTPSTDEGGDDDSDAPAASTGESTTELVVSLASSPETIDPQLNSSSDGGSYLVHLNEGLFRYSWDGNGVEYGLADSHEVSEDGLVWTLTIRDGAKWSDGQDVTADDFAYTMKRLVDPAVAAPYGGDMGQYIKNGEAISLGEGGLTPDDLGVAVIDEKTIEITLEGPCAYFDEILAFPVYYPVRQDIIEAHGDTWTRSGDTYITAGPYKMESFSLDQNLIVVPNEYYYDVDKLTATKITFQFLADEISRLTAFQSGEIMYSDDYPPEEMSALQAAGVYGQTPQLGTYYLNFNNEVAPFDDANVRKAFSLAIDRTYIAESVRQGTVQPADAFVGYGFNDVSGEFRVNGGAYFAANSEDYEANVEAARAALAEAGYPDGEGFPTVEYMYNEGAGHQTIAEAMQMMWQDVLNVNVELVVQEWNVFLQTRRNGEHQMARDGWIADYNDPMSMLTIFITGGGNNSAFFSNAEFDRLLGVANTSSDRAERMQAMHDAEEILITQEWACAPIYYYTNEYLADPGLKDFGLTPLGYKFFHNAHYEG